jgi:hypothetical protein
MTSSSHFASSLYSNVVTEKLARGNHVMWKAKVLAVLRGARLIDHVTSTIKTPP